MPQTALRYYIGPYVWTDLTDGFGEDPLMGWSPPANFVSAIDLRNETHASEIPLGTGGEFGSGYGLFCTLKSLPREYQLVGIGTLDSIAMNQARRDAFETLFGYRPQGSNVALAIADLLTNGSSPDWSDRVASAMPCGANGVGQQLRLEYRLIGNRGFRRNFSYQSDPHWNKVRDVLRNDYRKIFLRAIADNSGIDRKVLGHWIKKYRLQGVDEWKELIPPDLLNDARPPVEPSTTINDTFNRANADPGGNSSEGWAWTEASGSGYSVAGNRCKFVSTTHIRAATDLSTDDMYVQAPVHAVSAGNIAAVIARFSSSAVTGYHFRVTNAAGRVYEVDKVVAGAFTRLAYTNTTFPTLPVTARLEVDGSTLQAKIDGTVLIGPFSDTSITGNVRAGLYGTTNTELDDFQAADTTIAAVTSTGLLSPGTLANDSAVGTVDWTNVTNAAASDNTYATSDATATSHTTHYAKATNFGAALAAGSTINGVLVKREIKSSASGAGNEAFDSSLKLAVAGTISGTEMADTSAAAISRWPTTEGIWATGGSQQLWGLSLTESDVENSGFGFGLSSFVEDCIVSIDHMMIEIFYTEPVAGGHPAVRRAGMHDYIASLNPVGVESARIF